MAVLSCTLSVCAQPTYFLLSVGQAASDTLINGCHSVRAMLLLCVPPTLPASALRSGRTDLSAQRHLHISRFTRCSNRV